MVLRGLAETDTNPVFVTLTISAGGVLIATLVALYIRERAKKRSEEKKGEDDG